MCRGDSSSMVGRKQTDEYRKGPGQDMAPRTRQTCMLIQVTYFPSQTPASPLHPSVRSKPSGSGLVETDTQRLLPLHPGQTDCQDHLTHSDWAELGL